MIDGDVVHIYVDLIYRKNDMRMKSPGHLLPEPDHEQLKQELLLPKPEVIQLNDKMIRLIGIPFFGMAIPNISGLIRNELYTAWQLGAAYGWFILIAFAIWQGNRFLLFRLREKFSWLNHPIQKIISLFLSNTLYTVPLCCVMMLVWYKLPGREPLSWNAIVLATAICVICVIFITYIYELMFLASQWEADKLHNEKLQVTLNKFLVIQAPAPAAPMLLQEKTSYRQRLLVKKGSEFIALPVQEIAYVFTLEKIAFATDHAGTIYMTSQNLGELELLLDPAVFFRANRQYLVHIDAIVSFRSVLKGKLQLTLAPACKEAVIVSQENAAPFRTWLER